MNNKHQIQVTEFDALLKIIKSYPLATVITQLGSDIKISRLPVVVEELKDGNIKISGHLSTRNPQWLHLKSAARMILVFNGPNAYINSTWYEVNDVPTWNYVTVQAEGRPVIEHTHTGLLEILKATTIHTNTLYEDQWDFFIPEDLRSEKDLTESIDGFTLTPEKLSGKFKLSQSKSLTDQKRIIEELKFRKDGHSKSIAQLMAENLK